MKNQLKKSLSLVMAVLMILSCWVWVAPEKAEAAAPSSYDVKIDFNVSDQVNGGRAHADIYYIPNNGTGSVAGPITWEMDKLESTTGTYSMTYTNVPGWPCQIYFHIGDHGMKQANIQMSNIYINGTCVHKGTYTLDIGWWSSASRDFIPNTKGSSTADGKSGTVSGNSEGEWNWTRPEFQSPDVNLSPSEIALEKINTGKSSTSTITLSNYKDQYGVNWTPAADAIFTVAAADGTDLESNVTITENDDGKSANIQIAPWTQTLFETSSATLNVKWSVKGKSGTQNIKLNFPTYSATFHANGDDTLKDAQIGSSADDVSATGSYTLPEEKNYGKVIGKQPAFISRPGYDFMGFYSKDNPDALGKDASFSGVKFADNETKVKYEDYGVAAGDFKGDTNWYAAWQAMPIDITFMTQDRQEIAVVTGRYNNNLTSTTMYGSFDGLNDEIKAKYTGDKNKLFGSGNTPVYTDGSTIYNFVGWRVVKAYDNALLDKIISDEATDIVFKGPVTLQAMYEVATAKTYTITFEDGNGTTEVEQTGKKYREQITGITYVPTKDKDDRYEYEFIGWANDIGKNFYVVDDNNKDENGATVVYVHKDGASFTVRGDATYVPVFRMVPRKYEVTYMYKLKDDADDDYSGKAVVGDYHWQDVPVMPNITTDYTAGGTRYFLTGWQKMNADGTLSSVKKLEDYSVEGDITLYAFYGDSETAIYTINFYGKDETGEKNVLLNDGNNKFSNGDLVESPKVAQKIDTEDALYTFSHWAPTGEAEITTIADGDADYYATYTKKEYADVYFYNYDGTLLYKLDGKENSKFVGNTIPAYSNIVDGVEVLPAKAEDPVGTYKFIGWKDDEGNDVIPGTDKFDGDTHLYAQFETVYKNYTVKFLNDDGSVISEETYHYATEIEVPENPVKAMDDEYIYDFRAWSPDVSEVCYGDATYTATYRRTPRYYKVTWLKDNKTILSANNYKYNQTIQQAVFDTPVNYPDAGEGKTWGFKHWVQCDANGIDILDNNGNQIIFARGQKMPAEALYFYPVFEQVDNVLTVNFYKEDGTSYLGTAKIPYGSDINIYGDAFKEKAPKQSDATYHYIIEKWINIADDSVATNVIADISVRAEYKSEKHNKQLYEVIVEPTANVPGYANYKCEADECTSIDYNVRISPIADAGAPSGQIYVGLNNKWSIDGKWNAEDEKWIPIDYSDITYVSPGTELIVNAVDTGSISDPWNLAGKISRGVGKIEYTLSENVSSDPGSLTGWKTIYDYEELRSEVLQVVLEEKKITLREYNGYYHGTEEDRMKKAAIDREVDEILSVYYANATSVVSNLGLENGKEYIIYIRVSDREGNGEVNTCIFSSGKISYGNVAPEITVSGNGYGAKFCASADVRIEDDADGLQVYLDGEAVAAYTNPGTTAANGKFIATFETAAEGYHTVTVIDKHGNKTTKNFEIKKDHSNRNYTIAATCEKDGLRYDLCTLCGVKSNEEVLPAEGHSYTEKYIDTAPSCVKNGYRTYVCDNNCGTELVLEFNNEGELDATKVAMAKKWNEESKLWVALEADDLAHLKATGEHTFAKVTDENGNETDAWVVDKAATCKVEGLKHKDCTKCGYRVKDVIEIEENIADRAHKFYREKITTEPTCTTQGEKTKTCRYCGYVVHIEYIDALGHTDGEYKEITAATCETEGSKVLTCSTCGINIGEIETISALGHAWKVSGEIYQDTADGKWYQDYVCRKDKNHTKRQEVEDYQPPVAATVTFKNGDADHMVIKGKVSDVITADELGATPEKAADSTYRYIFSHWADEKGNEVSFPINVEGDTTYHAVFTRKYVNYTITYYKEDGTTEFKKTGYLHNGEEVTLANGPAKAETNLASYKFAGWKVNNSDPAVVYTDKVTIDAANISLIATYTTIEKTYTVTYAYSSSNTILTYTDVKAGTKAPDVTVEIPVEKAPDTKYHYEFKSWNKADQLANVVSDIYTTPDFEAGLHSYEAADGGSVETVENATCTTNKKVKYTCACGYSYTKEVPNTALGHDWADPVYNEATGKYTITCKRTADCDASEEDTRTFSAKFYVNEDDEDYIKSIPYLSWGATIEAISLPAAPKKDSTETTDYTFAGWYVKGDAAQTIVDFNKFEVKEDVVFVAKFTETTREYNVIFAYDANNKIKTITGVKAGTSVTFDGAKPAKAYDENHHYTFSNWKGYEAGEAGSEHIITVNNIQSDLYIIAEFKATKHVYTETSLNIATCQNGAGTRYICSCGKYYDVTGKPEPHKLEVVETKEATPYNDGYIKRQCTNVYDGVRCDYTETEVLKYNDNTMTIRVYVEHNGVAESGVKVEIQNAVDGSVAFATTNKDGYATFTVDQDGAYTCYVENGEKHQITLSSCKEGLEGSYSYTDQLDCTCACHRDNLWGSIFRFFHKIIKLFTGEFRCCENPDPMYG